MTENKNKPAISPETKQGVTRWVIREYLGVIFTTAIVLWAAGDWGWIWGWVLGGIYLVWVTANAILLIPTSPELLAERVNRAKSTKQWDNILMSFVGLLSLVKIVIAGLDYRYDWTLAEIAPSWRIVMALIAFFGYALGTWAMYVNAYFSMIVRIQEERGHRVAKGGPYRFVRHPAYIGTILFELATPILLGSWWAFIPGAITSVLFIIRTGLEDKTLLEELDGYQEFTEQTRYRLLPGIW
jgi:protein-S-isoprenylcysteine O-methyltransferase Ste14